MIAKREPPLGSRGSLPDKTSWLQQGVQVGKRVETRQESCWNSMVRTGRGGKMRNRELLRSHGCIYDCTIPVLCTQVLPSRPREEPWSSGCVGSSGAWSLTQHFTHSLLTAARFAQAASAGAHLPWLLPTPANEKRVKWEKNGHFSRREILCGAGKKYQQ